MNILTFDIEEWFHILDNDSTRCEAQWNSYECRIHANADRILDLLARRGQKATLFCLGWVAQKYPEIIRKADALGLEVGSHTHRHQLAYDQAPAEFRDDLIRSIDVIQQITGKKVRAFRTPGFSMTKSNPWIFEILAGCGIEMDSSVFPASRGHGGWKEFGASQPVLVVTRSGMIQEFPINVSPLLGRNVVFSGGGYFRLAPYPVIRYLMKRSPYVMTYFHPRDFDTDQPTIEGLSPLRVFKSYYGLGGALRKLERMLDEFEFVDLAGARGQIDWNTAARMTL